jgi:hypothetical protein
MGAARDDADSSNAEVRRETSILLVACCDVDERRRRRCFYL